MGAPIIVGLVVDAARMRAILESSGGYAGADPAAAADACSEGSC